MSATAHGAVKSDQDVADKLHEAAAIHLATLERNGGGKLDPRVLNNALGLYNFVRKAYFATGRLTVFCTHFDLAQALYPGVMTGKDAERKKSAVFRQLRRHEAAGTLRVRTHKSDAKQNLGLEVELVDEPPDPEAWPDFHSYSAKCYPERAHLRSIPAKGRRGGCTLVPRERLKRGDPRRRVHKWNRRIGQGAEHRYDVAPAFFSSETFCTTTSLPTPLGTTSRRGVGQASEERERRAPAAAAPKPWAALSRCRTAASGGGALAVLAVPRADWCSMAAAAFEARFVVEADGSWQRLGDPHFAEGPRGLDPELSAPEPCHRYITLSGPWARRLETWCRMYDRAEREPGAGIRSLIDDILSWAPADGAPTRFARDYLTAGPVDPGWPISLAFFVARLGRRAKRQRAARQPRRRENMSDWSMSERWGERL